MVDIAGGDGNADHSDHVLKIQKAAEEKSGDPNLETRLGEQQQRRMATRATPDSLSTPGFTRWDKT